MLPINVGDSGPLPAFDLGALFVHLLLFDTVILDSKRLREFTELLRHLDIGEVSALLDSGALKIRSAADSLASWGDQDPQIVHFVHLQASDHDGTFSGFLSELETPGVGKAARKRFKRLLVSHWMRPATTDTWGSDALKQATADIVGNRSMLLRAVNIEAQKRELPPVDHVDVEGLDIPGYKMRVIARGVDGARHAELVRRAALDIVQLNTVFSEMKQFEAVTAVSDDSLNLMEAKLDFLWRAVNPQIPVEQFRRVAASSEVPDFQTALQEGQLDVERFLEVRATPECREFRAFLLESERLSEDELRDRTRSLSSRIGNFLNAAPGKVLRILATTAAGFLGTGDLSLATGVGASGVDSFLLDKVFPKNGVVTFLGSQYPSIFRG